MAALVDRSTGLPKPEAKKHTFAMWRTFFEIDRKYIPMKPMGKGAYGVVCSAYNRDKDEHVAIKKINNVFECQTTALRILREIMLLRRIKHENVVALKDVMMPRNMSSFNELYLVYELMDTDLDHIIRSPQPVNNDHCKYLVFQLLNGLHYLHSANILHRDLKPGNLLINSNCDLKICDFGLSRTGCKEGEAMTEYVVTRWYRAPELLLSCNSYGASVDMWSVGCILAEILGRRPIFPGTDSLNQLKLIVSVLGYPSDADLWFIDKPKTKKFVQSLVTPRSAGLSYLFPGADPWAIDLLEKLLVFDPSKRITAAEALHHPYISTLYDPDLDLPAKQGLQLDVDDSSDIKVIREKMLTEILHYHPEVAAAASS